ncbi:MAG: DNRLRE domain-containing protein, partial [Woeseiaceae bacterium]|nr:DNRLRE domain-containing protein [Woeseiaceae bacterium]
LNYQSATGANAASDELQASKAEYLARAGMQNALWSTAGNACMGDVAIPDTPLGVDSFQASISGASAGTSHSLSVDQDAWIRSDNTSSNNGGSADLHIRFESGNSEHALARFDLSPLPAGSRIYSATAWFHISSTGAHPEGAVTAHEVSADWTESGATWETFGSAFNGSALAMVSAQSGEGVWVGFNLTGQVQAWANGLPNYGILLASNAEGVHAKYSSRESGSNAPRLDVVVGSEAASPVSIQAMGTLANGLTRTLTQSLVTTYQPPVTHVFRPGPGESEDAEIWQQSPDDNYGNSDETWVSSASNDTTRSLLRFDTGAIPRGARIIDATLSLERRSGSGQSEPISAHRITQSWEESSVTWNSRRWGVSWNTAGADFELTPYATALVGPANQSPEWDVTSLVQGWVDGSYPNYGVVLVATTSGMTGERFHSSDVVDPANRPSLTVTYACECGDACMAPQGAGDIMMVIDNVFAPSADDQYKRNVFESWGYNVDLWDDDTWQSLFDSSFANYDLAYVSESVGAASLGTKLNDAPIGIVTEEGMLNDEFGIATGYSSPVGDVIQIDDNSHYITAPFAAGSLEIFGAHMTGLTASGTVAGGASALATWGGQGSLIALDQGATLQGGGTAPARRVMVPIGDQAGSNPAYVNQNGWLLVQRAIAWASGNTNIEAGKVLLVVANSGSLTSQESAKQALMESWGYTVNIIDEDDVQADFTAAFANNDVVFVTEDATSSDVGNKLTAAEIGVVIEEVNLADELGLGASISWGSGTELMVHAGHYITAPLTPGTTAVLNTTESIATLASAASAEVEVPGAFFGESALNALDAGNYRFDGGGTAGRRVMLPWGGNNMDVGYLTDDGLTIFRRAIEWGAGACLNKVPLLMVVGDATSLDARDNSLRALLSDWCHTVTLIDDGADQAEFDAASSASRVIYVTYTVDDVALADKLTASTVGIVNEGLLTQDTFGFGENPVVFMSAGFTDTSASHYVSEPFGGAGVTLFTSNYSMPMSTGTIAPDIQGVASIGALTWALPVLEMGAERWDGLFSTGRRAHLPFGDAPIADLTADARTLLKRAVEWAAGYEPGLIAHWKLDEGNGLTAVDSAGGHDGTLLNGPAWSNGIIGGSVHFSDETHAISAPHSDTLTITGDLTLLAWVNLDELLPNRPMIQKGSSNINHNYYFGLANDNMQFAVSPPGGGWHVRGSGATGILPGSWHHLAVSFDDSTDQVAFYLDGAPFAINTLTHSPSEFAGPVRIGRNDNNYGIKGRIDDARVYRRVLAAGEIAELFDSQKAIPEAHWKLDETSGSTAEDAVGGHEGTTSNTEWVSGKVGGALRFNSSSDSVLVPHADEMSYTNEITVAAWINKTNFFGYDAAVAKATTGSDLNYFLGTWESNPVFGFSTSTDNWQGFYATSTSLLPNTWYHLAATFDNAADEVRIYLDGSLVEQFAAPQEPVTNTGNIMLGRSAIGEYWPGLLDEVRIFNRVLDSNEVSDLASAQGPPIAHWMLDDAGGMIAVDSAGGHDGTLNGNASWIAGAIGGGLAVDYADGEDYIEIPNSPGLENVQEGDYTLAAWFRPDSTPPGIGSDNDANYGILVKEGWHTGIFFTNDNRFGFNQILDGNTGVGLESTNTFSPGDFHHVAGVVDRAAGMMSIYVNGLLEGTRSFTPGAAAREYGTETWKIGVANPNGTAWGWPADGAIDDVRIYDQALPGAEIASLAAMGGGSFIGGGGGGCNGPFTDDFAAVDYSGGSANWTGNWQETGESTSPSGGDIRIANDVSNYQLLVRDDGQTVWREADLSAATSATLIFDYRRQSLNGSSDYVAVDVSYDGGSNWNELDRFFGTATDSSYLPYSRALDSASLSANTRIRFRTPNSGMSNSNQVWFDNLQITCTP